MSAKQNFHQISIAIEKTFVKWALALAHFGPSILDIQKTKQKSTDILASYGMDQMIVSQIYLYHKNAI